MNYFPLFLFLASLVGLSFAHPSTEVLHVRDDALEAYRNQTNKCNQEMDWATSCYNSYIQQVGATSPPSPDLLATITDCDDNYDFALIALQISRNMAFRAGFSAAQLEDEKLPNTTFQDTNTDQSSYTKEFQQKLKDMMELAQTAYKTRSNGLNAIIQAELSKPHDKANIDTSGASVKTTENDDGTVAIAITGAIVGGVVVGGVVTYVYFTSTSAATTAALAAAGESTSMLGSQVAQMESIPLEDLTVEQLHSASESASSSDVSLHEALAYLRQEAGILEDVPQDQTAAAASIHNFNARSIESFIERHDSVMQEWHSIRDAALRSLQRAKEVLEGEPGQGADVASASKFTTRSSRAITARYAAIKRRRNTTHATSIRLF